MPVNSALNIGAAPGRDNGGRRTDGPVRRRDGVVLPTGRTPGSETAAEVSAAARMV